MQMMWFLGKCWEQVAIGTTSPVPRFAVQVLRKKLNIFLTFILDHSCFFGIALPMNFVVVPFFRPHFPCYHLISKELDRLKVQSSPCRPGHVEAKAETWKVPSMPIQIEDKQAVEAAHAAATASCPKKRCFFFLGLDEFPRPRFFFKSFFSKYQFLRMNM